jgi:hypothetical protein
METGIRKDHKGRTYLAKREDLERFLRDSRKPPDEAP